MTTYTNISVSQLKKMIDLLPEHISLDLYSNYEVRRYKILEPLKPLIENVSGPVGVALGKEIEFRFNFETNDWELAAIIDY